MRFKGSADPMSCAAPVSVLLEGGPAGAALRVRPNGLRRLGIQHSAHGRSEVEGSVDDADYMTMTADVTRFSAASAPYQTSA